MPGSQPRYPLRLNVGFFANQPIGSNRDFPFEFPDLKLTPDLLVSKFGGVLRINRTPSGLLVQGNFKGETRQECVRCLAEFLQPLSAEFDELYSYRNRPISDSGLIVPDDGNIDFGPLVAEYMVLEIPIKPLCRPDCKGLCIQCGADLNETICEHQKRVVVEE